ncbi:MAG TPA: DEAD/DEAH box helicase [Acidimicrobiales bacterium]|nr:DEAD/DEAH box helicase [Acidimicrobiales bacterium]
MSRRVRLRPWQKEALTRLDDSGARDFLTVATPGAGKTTFALTAAVRRLAAPDGPRRLIVVAPTAHLKRQWAAAAVEFGMHLDHQWAAADGSLPGDMHGIVTTYQQVAGCAPLMGRLAAGAMVVFDEIHHAGDDRAWGAAVRVAFESAAMRLSLSGTPFRSDTQSIPFLRYELEEARPDFEYGYGDALAGGRVVRPVYFPRTNGDMEWSAPDGSTWAASFDDALDTVRANQRLRAALSLDGDWLPTVLRSAHERLVDLRRHHPGAGGLVIATDQDHARGIADALEWRHGVRPVVATSDDSGASDRIAAFASSDDPWLVAVRMVSEGVDIPRLRVGVYATTTTTELFFRQAVGRLVRWTPGVPNQRAYLFIPDDSRLRGWAYRIAETRRHSLRRDTEEQPEADPAALDELREEPAPDSEQLSLFAVISAVATDMHDSDAHSAGGSGLLSDDGDGGPADSGEDLDESLVVDLPVLAGPAGQQLTGAAGAGGQGVLLTRRELKNRLRDANAELARALAHKTGWPHAKVNAELNRLAGVRRVTEATVEQLQRRLRQAEHWYNRI